MSSDATFDIESVITGLSAALPEQERILEQAARNVEIGLKHDSEIYQAYTQLAFFALTVDFDMRVTLRALLSDPINRLTAEKFLTLTLEETDEAAGRMVNALLKSRHSRELDSGHRLFDLDLLDETLRAFNSAMSEMREDRTFNKTLRLIRNTVSGHIVGKEAGVINSAIWVLSRENVSRDPVGVMKSQIVYYSVATLTALAALSRGLSGALRA